MKCKFCLAKFDANEPYCPHCGTKNSVQIPGMTKNPIFEFTDEIPTRTTSLSQPARWTPSPAPKKKGKKNWVAVISVLVVLYSVLSLIFGLVSEFDVDEDDAWGEEIVIEDAVAELEKYYIAGDYSGLERALYSLYNPYDMAFDKYRATVDLYNLVAGWTSTISDPLEIRGYYLFNGPAQATELYLEGFAVLTELNAIIEDGCPDDNEEAVITLQKEVFYTLTDVLKVTESEVMSILILMKDNYHTDLSPYISQWMDRIGDSIT